MTQFVYHDKWGQQKLCADCRGGASLGICHGCGRWLRRFYRTTKAGTDESVTLSAGFL